MLRYRYSLMSLCKNCINHQCFSHLQLVSWQRSPFHNLTWRHRQRLRDYQSCPSYQVDNSKFLQSPCFGMLLSCCVSTLQRLQMSTCATPVSSTHRLWLPPPPTSGLSVYQPFKQLLFPVSHDVLPGYKKLRSYRCFEFWSLLVRVCVAKYGPCRFILGIERSNRYVEESRSCKLRHMFFFFRHMFRQVFKLSKERHRLRVTLSQGHVQEFKMQKISVNMGKSSMKVEVRINNG